MKKFIATAIASFALAASAQAADFNGPFIGAGLTLDNIQGSGALEGNGISGVGANIFAGYDLPVSERFFAGVEANADLYTADAPGVEAKWGWSLSGRVGTKLNDSTGLYARVGYARGKTSAGGFSEWSDAVRYGAGIETGLTQNVRLRAEFTQFNYEDSLINNQGNVALVYSF